MSRADECAPSTELLVPNSGRVRVRSPVVGASASDHIAIDFFLRGLFPALSAAEYQASLDDPFYEPCNRLLVRRERRLAAHAQITHRTMRFGSASIPTAGLQCLGVAREHRGQGLGMHLLRAAESRMQRAGAVLGLLRTNVPDFFRRAGWTECGRPSCRRAGVCAVLAQLIDRGLIPRRKRRLHIRPWLQWEHAALARVYDQNTAAGPASPRSAFGPFERTDAYWHWLLARRGFDEVYVALKGPEQLELGEISTRVVGYAAVRGERIVELFAATDRPRAAAELLARCCWDAIECGRHSVVVHAPPRSRLLRLLDEAGALEPPETCRKENGGEVAMMRLLAPEELLRRLAGLFRERAARARLPRPLGLGLLIEGRKYQIELARESVEVAPRHVGRSYLALGEADFLGLVLGQLAFDAAVDAGRIECSTALARDAGRALFPRLPFWRPPWDDLPSMGET